MFEIDRSVNKESTDERWKVAGQRRVSTDRNWNSSKEDDASANVNELIVLAIESAWKRVKPCENAGNCVKLREKKETEERERENEKEGAIAAW